MKYFSKQCEIFKNKIVFEADAKKNETIF